MSKPRFEQGQAVVVYHPHKLKTPAAKRVRLEVKLLERFGGVRVVDDLATSRDSRRTQDDLLRLLDRRSNALVIPIGADGTLNTITHALMRQDEAKRSGVLPTQSGSAKDFRHNHALLLSALDPTMTSLLRAMRRPPAKLFPLQMDVRHSDGSLERHYANQLFGENYTAKVARTIDGIPYRTSLLQKFSFMGRLTLDGLTIFNSFGDLETAQVVDRDHGDLTFVDRSLVHARRAGKHAHFPDVSHADPHHFLDIITTEPSPQAILLNGFKMALGRMPADPVTSVEFTNGDKPLLIHKDGEGFQLLPHDEVRVSLALTSIDVYGTHQYPSQPDY